MTPDEQIVKMTFAVKQAIKVMGDRFGSTEQDVARAIEGLKGSMRAASEPTPSLETLPRPDSAPSQEQEATISV